MILNLSYLPLFVVISLLLVKCFPAHEVFPTNEKIHLRDKHFEDNVQRNECSNDSQDACRETKVIPPKPQIQFFHQKDSLIQLHSRLNSIDKIQDDLSQLPTLDVTKGVSKTLRQVILIHRHGDRTPINFPPKDTLTEEPFWNFHGRGQLTNRGKARVYLLGKLMRKRYNQFLNKSVNKNQRISRASGSLRCIESAQMFLASFLELNSEDSDDAYRLAWDSKNNSLSHLWQPASVQSVPAKLDGMLAESAVCETLENEYENVIDTTEEAKKIFDDYTYEGKVLNSVLGFEMDHFYKWFWASSQIEVERSYFQDKMRPEIISIYDRVQEAGLRAMGAYQSTVTSRRLRSGLLINNMIEEMVNMRALRLKEEADDSTKLKKFVHYAAHDLTLVSLLGAFNSWYKYQAKPDYASSIIIELHQDEGEWFVKLLFMSKVPSELIEIHIDACEANHPLNRCTLEKFEQIMEPFRVRSWQQWNNECKNNLRMLNPYENGT